MVELLEDYILVKLCIKENLLTITKWMKANALQ